jgi:hypothetical protein
MRSGVIDLRRLGQFVWHGEEELAAQKRGRGGGNQRQDQPFAEMAAKAW